MQWIFKAVILTETILNFQANFPQRIRRSSTEGCVEVHVRALRATLSCYYYLRLNNVIFLARTDQL